MASDLNRSPRGSGSEVDLRLRPLVLPASTVGTRSDLFTDYGGTPRTINHEGRSGWTATLYATDPSSPFVSSGAFNFAQYLSTNGVSLAAGDWVLIELGTNDVFGAASDAAALERWNTFVGHVNTMITNIRSAVPGINIGLIPPPPGAATQEAAGRNYAAGQYRKRYAQNVRLFTERMLTYFDNAHYDSINVFVLWQVIAGVDPESGYPTVSEARSQFDSTVVTRQSDLVHPSVVGQRQMGWALYCEIRGRRS